MSPRSNDRRRCGPRSRAALPCHNQFQQAIAFAATRRPATSIHSSRRRIRIRVTTRRLRESASSNLGNSLIVLRMCGAVPFVLPSPLPAGQRSTSASAASAIPSGRAGSNLTIMPDSLLRPFPLLVLATVAITAGIIAFTASAGVVELDHPGLDRRRGRRRRRRRLRLAPTGRGGGAGRRAASGADRLRRGRSRASCRSSRS